MKTLNETQIASVSGATYYPLQTGSSVEVWFGFDRGAEIEEAARKRALREEAARLAAQNGTDATTEYVDLMGY
ncbi:hypothetical protein INR77_12185 [Erythrobacter sp. SCSIO 43205]|uniref:hypothetical protein n=1 Tax=Erythrobacter sp. SCSIO 43205 TaxID=2779361 RepID=UPI001CA95DE7|nr:hypothetical protein [Erythrobacter sp. SCSIO 43205]UAB77546.1 hypothetical protein INR77_12185 [Erythrobacter sp. SCSIO 43205]